MKKLLVSTVFLCSIGVFCISAAIAGPAVTFQASDEPGSWFVCSNTGSTTSIGCVPEAVAGAGQKSLAVVAPGDSVAFASLGQANTLHTAVSLLFPTGAANMPFDNDLVPPVLGGDGSPFSVKLKTPGLYVFFCDIHPYMFAAVVVDNPRTTGLDFGNTVDLPRVGGGITIPTTSDLALRLLHTFFVITNPNNWQTFPTSGTASWNPSYPPVGVLANGTFVSDLNVFLRNYFHEPKQLSAPVPPTAPGVGQIWVNTQFEKMAEKTKPGTATAIDAGTFKIARKVGLPQINMNNPHNMWTDKDQTVIYQTQWFDNTFATFSRTTGNLVQNLFVGPAPAHVMTRTNNDQVHVSLNGGNAVAEYQALASAFIQNIPMGDPSENVHPHAHWMSAKGMMMVTPNEDSGDSTLYSFSSATKSRTVTGSMPIATGMMPDSSKYYVANFLDSTLSVITITGPDSATPMATLSKTINLLQNYDPISGAITGPVGGLPIQSPVSPDGKYAITANTLTGTITIIDTKTDSLVAMLPCDPGCHGVQFGAKKGGGYYAYVSSKLSNRLIVVDPDPNGAGNAPDNGSNAVVAGTILLSASGVPTDGTVSGNAGMGGQGVLPIPVVYNGWVQNLPTSWKNQLTPQQQNPFPAK